jgi:hypothetical protein
MCLPISSATLEAEAGRIASLRPSWAQIGRSVSKQEDLKGWEYSSMVEHLPSMLEALGSVPTLRKKLFLNLHKMLGNQF